MAALGTTVEVETIEGAEPLEVPPGTQPHEVITLRGKGMPSLRGRKPGDLRVVINVVTPRNLSHAQREQLERFAESLKPENLSSDEGVFAKLRRALHHG